MSKFYFQIKSNLVLYTNEDNNFVLHGNHEYDLSMLNYSLYLLPLLEHNSRDFWAQASLYPELDMDQLKTIIQHTLRFPFDHQMGYWADKAIAWIDTDNLGAYVWLLNIDESFLPQKQRHIIFRFKRRIERMQSPDQ